MSKGERRCIACGAQKNKFDMLRIVRTPLCEVRFDKTGKAAGRGAYVCDISCFDKACAEHRFARALHINVSEYALQAVRESLKAAV